MVTFSGFSQIDSDPTMNDKLNVLRFLEETRTAIAELVKTEHSDLSDFMTSGEFEFYEFFYEDMIVAIQQTENVLDEQITRAKKQLNRKHHWAKYSH